MATSQFANGKLEILKKQGEKLALPGGYNKAGELTQDPSEILSVQSIAHIVVLCLSRLTVFSHVVGTEQGDKARAPNRFLEGLGAHDSA